MGSVDMGRLGVVFSATGPAATAADGPFVIRPRRPVISGHAVLELIGACPTRSLLSAKLSLTLLNRGSCRSACQFSTRRDRSLSDRGPTFSIAHLRNVRPRPERSGGRSTGDLTEAMPRPGHRGRGVIARTFEAEGISMRKPVQRFAMLAALVGALSLTYPAAHAQKDKGKVKQPPPSPAKTAVFELYKDKSGDF